MVYEMTEPGAAASLFEGWQETLIWSCLQGVMGRIYADSRQMPVSAAALLGDFCFFAGEPDRRLLSCGPAGAGFRIMVPQNEEWAALMEDCFGERARRVVRYALKKEPEVFCTEDLLRAAEALPRGYCLKMMDEELFAYCGSLDWCRDWVSQYKDYAMYRKFGLGAVILRDGEPVSGASSYSGYLGGIEIEIDTREDCRRRGLAHVCGARLILECLKRGWYPGWDAQNKGSLALAQKLGYHFSHEYAAYEVRMGV